MSCVRQHKHYKDCSCAKDELCSDGPHSRLVTLTCRLDWGTRFLFWSQPMSGGSTRGFGQLR